MLGLGQGYTQILEMIMKRLNTANIDGFSAPNIGFPDRRDEELDSLTPTNPFDPKTIRAFEDYDYRLYYDNEENLTEFTSHDGRIRYTLNNDAFGELITITVTIPSLVFMIALIYENFDIRKKDPETDEKGLLIEVVILTIDGQPFPLGLFVRPPKIVADIGDTVQFKAIVENLDGSVYDVTDNAGWSASNPKYSSIFAGRIENVEPGKSTISAAYDMQVAHGELEVRDFTIEVEPPVVNIELAPGETTTVTFRAYKVLSNGTRTEITNEGDWSSHVFSNNGPEFTVESDIPSGQVFCDYKGRRGTGRINVIEVEEELKVVPDFLRVNRNTTATYRAMYTKGSAQQDVSSISSWSIDEHQATNYQINSGVVSNLTDFGTANVTAFYKGMSDTAQLEVALVAPNKNIRLQIWDHGAQDEDTIDMYFNGTLVKKNLVLQTQPANFFYVNLVLVPGKNVLRFEAVKGDDGTCAAAVKITTLDGQFIDQPTMTIAVPANTLLTKPYLFSEWSIFL